MPHMVVYRNSEGKPAYQQAEALDEAVRFVEHLRNSESIGEARIFKMHEVAIEFKTYYRVEVAEERRGRPAEPAAAPPAPAPTVSAPVPSQPRIDVQEPSPLPSGNGRFGLFGKG